jgi:rubrerythrin
MNDMQCDQSAAPIEDDLPGDPVCLLRRACQQCGSLADHDPPTTCPVCHADIPAY